MRKLFYVFSFVLMLFFVSDFEVKAKVSNNPTFEVEVGEGDVLPIYYTLQEDDQGNVKERINFSVTLRGVSKNKNNYRWEHTFCFAINGGEEVCEYDLTGSDQENPQYIYSNETYDFTFYDGDMPYYSEDLVFDYVVFKNKLVCLDCENSTEIILDDIRFESSDINYKYNYEISVSYVENEGRKYVANYSSGGVVYVKATFINNSSSSLTLEGAPTYKLVNEVCVEESNCVSQEIEKVYSSSDTNNENPFSITPYLGNLSYYYYGDNLVYVNGSIPYDHASYKTKLVCLTNCESRRIVNEIILNEEDFYFDYTKPSVDKENTKINSYVNGEEITYVKNSEVKISVGDNQSGLNTDSLKYYIVTPYYNSCSWGSTKSYSFVNGESFVIGEGLTGGYCMYYSVSDKNGNNYTSEYYVFYFDNSGPSVNFNNVYDSNKAYNDVNIAPSFADNYSGLKEVYYLWSRYEINTEDYILVKNNGKLFNESVSSKELNEDGSYHLYFLSFDNLNNYSFNDLGVFNIDTHGLEEEDVSAELNGFSDAYSNTGVVKISVNGMSEGEEFKCGFFVNDSVEISKLNKSCYNNKEFNVHSDLEGEYNLFIYAHDGANNYSLFKVASNLKIDTKSPKIDVSILYDDDTYRIVNEVTLNVSDLSGVNPDSLKYGWFLKSKTGVLSGDLSNSFVSGEGIKYPLSSYGEYKLYISAIDSLGNEKFISLDKVFKIDTDIIRISLVGEETVTILKGEEYVDLGALAYKGEVISGGRVSKVKVEGKVDSNKSGVYYITYSSGEGELLVSVTRKVIVKNDLWYIVGSCSLFVIGGALIWFRLFVRQKEE